MPQLALPLKKPFGAGYVLFPALLVIFGIVALAAARQLGPQTTADEAVFRSDPSCAREAPVAGPRGACQTVAATVVGAEMRESGSGKTRAHSPMVLLRYADGTFHEAELDGGAGEIFVYDVASGTPARAQLFRGELVRVTARSDAAETIAAPDVNAETVGEMPWVGSVAIAAGLLIFGARIYVTSRGK